MNPHRTDKSGWCIISVTGRLKRMFRHTLNSLLFYKAIVPKSSEPLHQSSNHRKIPMKETIRDFFIAISRENQ